MEVYVTIKKTIPLLIWNTPPPIYVNTPLSNKLCNPIVKGLGLGLKIGLGLKANYNSKYDDIDNDNFQEDGKFIFEPELNEILPEGNHVLTCFFEPPTKYLNNYQITSQSVPLRVSARPVAMKPLRDVIGKKTGRGERVFLNKPDCYGSKFSDTEFGW
jgi:hypothetical protein